MPRTTASDRVLRGKGFNIPKYPKYDGYQKDLASMVYKVFDKKTSGSAVKSEIMSNQQLAEELHKRIIKKFENRKVHLSFIDNIWGADLADMQLISKFNKEFIFYYVLLIFNKNAWVVLLKDKKCFAITNASQQI